MEPNRQDPGFVFAELAKGVRDAAVPADVRAELFDAVEAAAASHGTGAFGARCAELAELSSQHGAAFDVLQAPLRRLAAMLH